MFSGDFLVSPTTWNPADKGTAIGLSNANRTLTSGTSAGMARATKGKSAGLWQWEVTPSAGSIDVTFGIGIANLSAGLNTVLGNDVNGWSYDSTGQIRNNAAALSAAATYTRSDVITIALDMDAKTCAFYKNGSLQYTVTGLTGTIYPAQGCGTGILSSQTADANFGTNTLVYPVAGFNKGIF